MVDIRQMNFEELRQLVDWANDEGWNPGLNDAQCFWSIDPEGYLAACENHEFVGGGAIVRHSESFGFMGLFIVSKLHRGKKLGTQLWFARRDHLLSRLNEGGTIGLDGVDAMVPFYERGGFKQLTRHRRFELDTAAPEIRRPTDVVDLRSVNLETVADFDRRCFPARREQFLAEWINQPGAVSSGFVEDGKLLGFGVMRPCVTGWKIGPLFADSDVVADALIQSFQIEGQGKPIFLDAPDNNPSAIALCSKYRMKEIFGCVRMYYGPVPKLDHDCIFGVTTLEVG